MLSCPDVETIQAFLSRSLPEAERESIVSHVAGCAECRALISSLDSDAAALEETVSADPAPADRELAAGTHVGRFVVKERLGGGAMGVVYSAFDPELDRSVALKLLRPGLGGSSGSVEARVRIRREAQALARVEHENVIAVYDVGTFGEQVFIAMELVLGSTLRVWLKATERPVGEILRVFRAAAAGLAAAHSVGVVHRDFKPDNVLIGHDGRVRVTDFGLARRLEKSDAAPRPSSSDSSDDNLTVDGTLIGTPAYMSPEQIAGKPAEATSDEFSFCVALYEASYGERPFTGRTLAELGHAIASRQMRPVPARGGVPARVRRAILRGLSFSPADRYPTIADLAAELEETRRPRPWLLALPLVVLAAGAGAYLVAARGPSGRARVAVLPFVNAAGRPEAEWLATALQEMLTSELGAGEKLSTVATEAVRRAHNELGDDRAVAERVGARYLVAGSFVPQATKVGVDLRLVDAEGDVLLAHGETASEVELVDLAVRAGTRVRGKLGVSDLSAEEVSQARRALPASPEAARPYAEGLARVRERDPSAARALFEEAVAKDPDFALARSMLARVLWELGYGDLARGQAAKALALAERLGPEEKLVVQAEAAGAVGDARREIDTYSALFTRYPEKTEYGVALMAALFEDGRRAEALIMRDKLVRLGAEAATALEVQRFDMFMAMTHNDFPMARAIAAKLLERGKAQKVPYLVTDALFIDGEAAYFSGDLAHAWDALDEARRIDGEARDLQGVGSELRFMAWVRMDQGRLGEARQLLEELTDMERAAGNTRNRWRNPVWISEIMVKQGLLRPAETLRNVLSFRYLPSSGARAHALIAFERGDLGPALRRADDAIDVWKDKEDIFTLGAARAMRADIERELGDFAAARGDLQAALALQDGRALLMAARTRMALAALELDQDRRGAEALLDAGEAATAGIPADRAELLSLRALARARRGDAKGAKEALAAAQALLPSVEDVTVRWRAALHCAEVARDPDAAAAIFAVADAGGYTGIALEARLLLSRLGREPRARLVADAAARGYLRIALAR